MKEEQQEEIYDYIIIGSGFGGSVSAMRLAEKGYSVLVIEKGKRYEAKDFPKTDWDIKRFLWAPLMKCFGIQQLSFFKEVFILSGVGVGGGSLVYGNTHMIPGKDFFESENWSRYGNWEQRLMPFYNLAKYMLGTIPYDRFAREDEILKEIAEDMGRGDSFGGVNVGVYYGDTQKAVDPYFNGLGPERTGCVECAGCFVGCRHGAKNSLDKNYLYFAEKFGAKILAETSADGISFENGEYSIETSSSTSWGRKKQRTFKSKGLVVSGGVLGSMNLLLKHKYEKKTLTGLSDKLGINIRTNSESICGVTNIDEKVNHGIAITSYFNPDDNTHIEVCKYNDESGVMGRLAVLATGEGNGFVRSAKLLGNVVTKPWQAFKAATNVRWGKNSLVILVMQSLDSSMKMVWKKRLFGGGKIAFDNTANDGARVPAYIDIGQKVIDSYAKKTGGTAINSVSEVVFNTAVTAHILGGCPMGDSAETGVVNEKFEVHGYPNMYVLDGSIIPHNLGVNPSLTITALSEWAMSHVKEKEGNTSQTLEQQIAALENL